MKNFGLFLAKDSQGRDLIFPYGRMGKARVVTDTGKVARLRKIYAGLAIITALVAPAPLYGWLSWSTVVLIVLVAIAINAYAAHRLTREFPVVEVHWESSIGVARVARAHGTTLYFYFAFCALLTLAVAVIVFQEPSLAGIAGLTITAIPAGVIAWAIWLGRN
jgi:hypothetical protein